MKNKEITNQQIKDALRANNCTSVEFDEVKLATNTATCLKYSLKYYNAYQKRYELQFYPNAFTCKKARALILTSVKWIETATLAWPIDRKTTQEK